MTRDPKPMMAASPGPGTGLDGYATEFNGQQHVNFIGDDGDVHELVYTDHWVDNDLSQAADPANFPDISGRERAVGSPHMRPNSTSQQHVNYFATSATFARAGAGLYRPLGALRPD